MLDAHVMPDAVAIVDAHVMLDVAVIHIFLYVIAKQEQQKWHAYVRLKEANAHAKPVLVRLVVVIQKVVHVYAIVEQLK